MTHFLSISSLFRSIFHRSIIKHKQHQVLISITNSIFRIPTRHSSLQTGRNLSTLLVILSLSLLDPSNAFSIAPPDQSALIGLHGKVQDLKFKDYLTKTKGNPNRSYRHYRTAAAPSKPEDCWPTLYFYHGVGGSHQSYPFLLKVIDSLDQAGAIAPIQVLQINGNVGRATASFYTNSKLFGSYFNLIDNYFPKFAQKYHKACQERDQNFIMGHSMGAFGALQLALKSSLSWGGVAMHSGPVDLLEIQRLQYRVIQEHQKPHKIPYPNSNAPDSSVFDPTRGKYSFMLYCMAGAFSPNKHKLYSVELPFKLDGTQNPDVLERWQKHNPIEILKGFSSHSHLPHKIWIDVGVQDHLQMLIPNQNLSETLSLLKIPHQFEVYPGGHGNRLKERFTLSLLYLLGK